MLSYLVTTYILYKNGAVFIFVVTSKFTKLIITKNLNVTNRRYVIQISAYNSVIFRSLNSNYQKSPFSVVGGTLVKLASWQGSEVLPSA